MVLTFQLVQICRYSEASVLDSAAYLLFYVKQGSSPWFSTLLEKEDKFPQDGSVSLAEQGTSEIAPVNNEDEESTCSRGQDNSGYCLVGPAEENGNGPGLPDFSQDMQWNGNVRCIR
jgi:ubiquitin carboxyl-terminal hydrolase 36/42